MAQELIDKIRAAAQAKGIDPDLALRIARVESGLRVNATPGTSSAGGLFQVVDKTWKEFGGAPGKKFDADENIRVGTDIIAKNTQTLKDFLQRAPRPAEVYAAHYFGPSGAKSFLSAEAGTPMESLFSKEVLKANPNLKGQTRDQVMASLEKKMGGASAPIVSRETKQAKAPAEPTPAEEMMTKALPAGMSAQAPKDVVKPVVAMAKMDIQSMPASYRAAFALAALADAQDEEDDRVYNENKGTETEAFFANYKPVNHLASLDLGETPVMMKDGGEVTARQDEPFFPSATRTYFDALTGRKEPFTEKDFTAREQMAMMDAVNKSQARGGKGRVDYQDYPDAGTVGPGYVDIRNTLGGFGYKQQPDGSTVISDRYDFHGPRVDEYAKMGTGEKVLKSAKNALVEFVRNGFSPRDMAGELGDAFIGRGGPQVNIRIPVRRAGGGDAQPTEEEIAAASTPAFIAQKSGIGRRAGPISQALKSGEGYVEAAKGLTNVPQNVLGAPMDISNMVAGIYGGNVDKPFMGSEYLKDKSRAAGLGFTPSTDPTLAGFYAAGDLGSNLVNPAGATRAGVQAAGKAARMMEGMKDIPVGMSIKPVQSIYTPTPSADAPFVGRLDEFVSGLPGPVQKDQFLGMLKGKMRDYEIARAESTLADLPGNAKLSPVDLLNRIKTQYDPAEFKTTIVPPGQQNSYFQATDNPYYSVSGNSEPLGVIHLSQAPDPAADQVQEIRKKAAHALYLINSSAPYHRMFSLETADNLLRAADRPALGLSESTANGMRTLGTQYRQLALKQKAIKDVSHSMFYPASEPKFFERVNAYANELENQGMSYEGSYKKATVHFTKEAFEKYNNILRDNNLPTVPAPDFDSFKNPAMWAIEKTPRSEEIKAQTLDLFESVKKSLAETKQTMEGPADELMKNFKAETKSVSEYAGQHASLKNPPNPISFSRFSEHTTNIPGIGKAEGIYVNELQSDLLDDLRKKGLKGGSLEKDEKKLRELEARMRSITDPAERQAMESKMRNLRTRLFEGMGPNNTPKEGFYQLTESFPGMQSSPQVVQQLMVKNAVSGAMQMGKQFVAFPGKESAQAQLYEKLGPNLKSVVKDLGPGFELRDVTLRDPDGKQLMHKAIVWGPEAASRVQKKGVPFRDGGSVERQPTDNRRYL